MTACICFACRGSGLDIDWMYCIACGGTGYVLTAASDEEDEDRGLNPAFAVGHPPRPPLPTVAEIAGIAPDIVSWREVQRMLIARAEAAEKARDTLATHVLNLIAVADLGAARCKRRRDCTCEVCKARKATEDEPAF